MMKFCLVLLAFLTFGTFLSSLSHSDRSTERRAAEEGLIVDQPFDLGSIDWFEDFPNAKKQSLSSGKPMLVLFQKSRGCQKCQNFADQTLAHPLVSEAINEMFVPVAIGNNQQSDDGFLKDLWGANPDHPAVAIMNSNGDQVVPPVAGIRTTDELVNRMISAMRKSGKVAPEYLEMTKSPTNAKTELAEFAMHCYWEGEAKLGSITGVHSTRSGWRDGLEVVQLSFSPDQVKYSKLLETAQSFDCASRVFAHSSDQLKTARRLVGDKASMAVGPMRDAKASDQKYYLAHTSLIHLPLTERQATKLNAAAKFKKPVDIFLSPHQIKTLKLITSKIRKEARSLDGFRFPEESAELAGYWSKLLARLNR